MLGINICYAISILLGNYQKKSLGARPRNQCFSKFIPPNRDREESASTSSCMVRFIKQDHNINRWWWSWLLHVWFVRNECAYRKRHRIIIIKPSGTGFTLLLMHWEFVEFDKTVSSTWIPWSRQISPLSLVYWSLNST